MSLPSNLDFQRRTELTSLYYLALLSLNAYFASAFKTGSYPSISKDRVWLQARPHAKDAVPRSDSVGPPTGGQFGVANGGQVWLEDSVFAVVLAQGSGSVTLSSGSNSVTSSVNAGVNYVKCPLKTG